MLVDNIKNMSKEKKIPMYKIESDLGIAKGSISKWGEVKPSYDKVIGVSKRLGVTVEELVGENLHDRIENF